MDSRTMSRDSWHTRSGFDDSVPVELVSALFTTPAQLFTGSGMSYLYKHDKGTTVVKVIFSGREYVVKRFNSRSMWHRVKRALRQSRARKCWDMARLFEQAGIRTAKPMGYLEQRWGPFCGDSYYVCEHIDGEICGVWISGQDESIWEAFCDQAEALFLAMWESGLSHGDMKATNLIWSKGELYLIDLDAACRPWIAFRRNYLARRDRQRFMRNWTDSPKLLARLESRLRHY
jgi:tRNA A-37 threonylcarbamoyl transferase component Bud32